jgi:hypothetical protein
MAQRNGQWSSSDCVRSTLLHKAVAKAEHDPAPGLGLRGVVIISPLTAATGCLTSPASLRTLPTTVRHLALRPTTPCWGAPHIAPSTLCATHRRAARATVPRHRDGRARPDDRSAHALRPARRPRRGVVDDSYGNRAWRSAGGRRVCQSIWRDTMAYW